MSRQRLRTGVLEASTRQCPHCEGTGLVRTASSAGLSALRLIEDEAARGRGSLLTLRASQEAAFYVLNRKRAELAEIEDRYGVRIEIVPDGEQEGARMSVEASGPPPAHAPRFEAPIQEFDEDLPDDVEDEAEEIEEEAEDERPRQRQREDRGEGEEGGSRRRRRRRGRRGRNREEGEAQGGGDGVERAEEDGDAADGDIENVAPEAGGGDEQGERGEGRRRRGRRGRRGGRRPEGEARDAGDGGPVNDLGAEAGDQPATNTAPVEAVTETAPVEDAPKKTRRRPRARTEAEAAPVEVAEMAPVAAEPAAVEADAPKPKRTRRKTAVTTDAAPAEPVVDEPASDAPADEAKPKKRAPRRKVAAVEETPAIPLAVDSDGAAPADAAAAGPVGDNADAAGDSGAIDADPGEAGSARRGWWQRTFGQ